MKWYKDLDRAKALWNLSYCIFLVSVAAYVIVDFFVTIPESLIVIAAVIAGAIALLGFYYGTKYSAEVKKIREKYFEKLDSISSPLSFVRRATPGQSLIDEMQKRDISPGQISKMYLQTGALCDEYLAKVFMPQLVSIAEDFEDLHLTCAGFGCEDDCDKFIEVFSSYAVPNVTIECKLTTTCLTEHFNVFEMKNGDLYTWFEPVHKTPPMDRSPEYGAFFSKVLSSKRSEAIDIYNTCLA